MEDVKLQLNSSELLQELKTLAKERNIRRLDENFLERFLVGRSYDVSEALRVLCNYDSFTSKNGCSALKWQKSRLEEIIENNALVVFDKFGLGNQKLIWIRVDKWDTKKCTADELLEIAELLGELTYQQGEGLVPNFDMILDLKNLSLRHLSALSPAFAKKMIHYIGACVPMKITNIFIVRQSKLFHMCYAIFKPFLDDNIKSMIQFCGENFESLISRIGTKMLPTELGGENENFGSQKWIELLHSRNTEKALEHAGYQFY